MYRPTSWLCWIAALWLVGCSQTDKLDEKPEPPGPVEPGTLPDLPVVSGVVYVAHYHTNELLMYRTDGANPYAAGTLDLGQPTHGMALDPYNDLLAVASDVGSSIVLYALSRPPDTATATPAPELKATVVLDTPPYYVRIDPLQHRLYAVAPTEPPPTAVDEFFLHAFDISQADAPRELDDSPYRIPTTTSLDLDPVREVLFLVENTTQLLYAYDLAGDGFTPLPGDPIELEVLFPQENMWAFQARNLTVDPWRHRILAARPQGTLSELIVLSYPDPIPSGTSTYGDLARMDDLSVVPDAFDVDVDHDQRPNLLMAYHPVVDLETGSVFVSADAWNGTMSSSILTATSPEMSLATGCDAFEGFGCWYQSYSAASPNAYLQTDGATCVDWQHRVVVGSTYDITNETLPGKVVMFSYDETLAMTPWLPADGGNLPAGALPVAVFCH